MEIYKNGKIDDNWTVGTNNSSYYGGGYALIDESLYDSSATYTATYELLDKYDFTTNNNDVTVHFANSLKSAFYSTVAKQSDIATDVSVLDRQMLDVLIRLDALESGN